MRKVLLPMRFTPPAAILLPALAFLSACATVSEPAPAAVGEETYIPYANRDGITEWRRASDEAIYTRALTGGWYLVRLTGPCPGLRSELPLQFDTRGGRLDRFSTIIVERDICPVESVTRIEGEPPQDPKRR
ncbi:MAG TPA: DUF6491 family protein [Allosphingosinicella sp.]